MRDRSKVRRRSKRREKEEKEGWLESGSLGSNLVVHSRHGSDIQDCGPTQTGPEHWGLSGVKTQSGDDPTLTLLAKYPKFIRDDIGQTV